MLLNYKLPEHILNQTSKNDQILSIRLNQETREMLDKLSKENNRSKSEIIRIAIRNLVK